MKKSALAVCTILSIGGCQEDNPPVIRKELHPAVSAVSPQKNDEPTDYYLLRVRAPHIKNWKEDPIVSFQNNTMKQLELCVERGSAATAQGNITFACKIEGEQYINLVCGAFDDSGRLLNKTLAYLGPVRYSTYDEKGAPFLVNAEEVGVYIGETLIPSAEIVCDGCRAGSEVGITGPTLGFTGRAEKTVADVPNLEELLPYACEQVKVTLSSPEQ